MEKGVLDRIFAAVADDPDLEWLAIDVDSDRPRVEITCGPASAKTVPKARRRRLGAY